MKVNLETKLRNIMAGTMAATMTMLPTLSFTAASYTDSHAQKGINYLDESEKPRITAEQTADCYTNALHEFKAALKIDEKDCKALTGLGRLFMTTGFQCRDAVDVLDKAVDLGCGDEAIEYLSQSHMRLNELKEAEMLANTLIENKKRTDKAYNLLGFIHWKKQEYKDALIDFKKGAEINPNAVYLLSNIGSVYEILGDNKKAEKMYLKAIKINPDYSTGHFCLGKLYLKLNQKEKAKAEFEKAVELEPAAVNYKEALEELK